MPTPSTPTGLMLCAHGSRSESWRRAITTLADALAASPAIRARFSAGVTPGFLNSCTPSLAEASAQLFSQGASSIVALPLFVTASAHCVEELPVVLGLKADPDARLRLQQEGITCLDQGSPVTLSRGLGGVDIVPSSVARRSVALAPPSLTRAVVVPFYGSTRYPQEWVTLLGHIKTRVLEEGFGACVGAPVGQVALHSSGPTRQAISALLGSHEEVLVVPALVAKGKLYPQVIEVAIGELSAAQRAHVRYRADAILPDPAIAEQLERVALGAALG